ncbi:uncharacterized protein ACLA_055540 [Aspergillus clavatus NRRL 1]|uniref:Uncharacterized protein n=1 Tax=Aspergillus clavatus (strain ATCC 1007 / CBS 513.65 / DSM 816 / NCTC 3887 / NRRL 1 / QM 1276 / 107) TaxID=344612 RepID=A1C9I2_ASPCL|nr:uncharacterized protein ACLA_055540 [Aspergillus clavatus NRRL 1]EAW13506.1 hypothetical protein ACLA_055540 [Aspergillus clavatus NRRL 1]
MVWELAGRRVDYRYLCPPYGGYFNNENNLRMAGAALELISTRSIGSLAAAISIVNTLAKMGLLLSELCEVSYEALGLVLAC